MIVIGIVGSPAGGKSTVARRLRELGATWINADVLAHRCLRMPPVREALQRYFGSEILSAAGELDRRALAARVFGDDAASAAALDYLESVIHPNTRRMVVRRLQRARRCGLPAAVLDAPLLLEADWGVLCDELWCVDAPTQLRLAWIESRGWDADELHRRERRQMAINEKRRLSTRVLENDGGRQELLDRTDLLWGQLMRAAQERQLRTVLSDPAHC